MNNFSLYEPEYPAFGSGVQYFKDDKGRDFYQSRDLFSKKYVVFFDSFGMVRTLVKSSDVTSAYPLGLSAVDINSIPKDFDIGKGFWLFDGKKVVSTPFDLSIGTRRRKQFLMRSISNKVTPLQDAVDLKGATEEEMELYNSLRKLRLKLSRIDDNTPVEDVDWSEFSIA